MADLLKELIEFAEEVRSTIPSSTTGTDVSKWMQKARYFTNECIVGGRLKENLEPFIPLKRRGELVQAVDFVNGASSVFQGQVKGIKHYMDLIIKELREATTDSQEVGSWLREDPQTLDTLLGLGTKEVFLSDIATAIFESNPGEPLALLFVDVDEFKKVNDNHGHQVGDEVLSAIAKQLRAIVKAKGKTYRYAGDEFTLLLPNANDEEAAASAERLRMAVQNLQLSISTLTVTVSIGIAVCWGPNKYTAETLVKEADEAMYKSKASGKNRVYGPLNRNANDVNNPFPAALMSASQPANPVFSLFPADSFIFSNSLGEHRLALPEKEHVFLRVTPSRQPRLSTKVALEVIRKGGLQPMGGELVNGISERNRLGAFVCSQQGGKITRLTQVDRSGEFFGMDFETIDKNEHMRNAGVDFGFIPCARFEYVFVFTLQNYLKVAAEYLKLPPPLSFTAGVSGVLDFRLAAPNNVHFGEGSKFGGRALENGISHGGQITSYDEPVTSLLRPFFEHLWEEFGEDRPDVEQLT